MRCVLHIGTEKTATTFLQNWLYENEAALSKQGVALSRVMGIPNNRKFVSYVHGGIDDYLTSKGIFDTKGRAAFFDGYEEELAAEFQQKSKSHDTFVITSEHFHSRLLFSDQIKRILTCLAPYCETFRVVCYFREQSQKRTSLYSTQLRVGGGLDVEAFQNDVSPDSHHYNYLLSFGKWESVFGADALVPRIYDRNAMAQNDIRLDFIKCALPDVTPELLSYDGGDVNTALSEDEASLFQAINAMRSNKIGRVPDHLSAVLRNLVANLPFVDKSEVIKDTRQEAMYDVFDDANRSFFSRYFGRDENLFDRPRADVAAKKDAPKYTLSDLTEFSRRVAGLENLVLIEDHETHQLHSMALKLFESKAISASDAILLLSIVQKAKPDDESVGQLINRLWSDQ